jgi:SAM-dependent MidA family methyltransferase
LSSLGENFPENYRTEVRTNFRTFLEPLLSCLSSGLLVWPDYGFARPEYYHPDRTTGTLRTFSKHRAAEDPLATPGEIDITAHVDFTAVAQAAAELGCRIGGFRNQGAWLTEVGREWLLSWEGSPQPQALRQFQTLTHPAHLGGSFHVLELLWNRPDVLTARENDLHRLAL